MKLNSRFDAELKELQRALEDMMSFDLDCLKAIADALETERPDETLKIKTLAAEIDKSERSIEALCLRILLTRHPVASDLRRVSATLKMITDLQRIGHQCRDFADILTEEGEPLKAHLPRLAQIADQVVEMFEGAITACVHDDSATARAVALSDNEVDGAYAMLRKTLAEELRQSSAPDRLMDVLMLGKYLERMADHIVLFTRWVVFAANGTRSFDEADESLENFEETQDEEELK